MAPPATFQRAWVPAGTWVDVAAGVAEASRRSVHPPPSALYSVTWLVNADSCVVMKPCCAAYSARCESSDVR